MTIRDDPQTCRTLAQRERELAETEALPMARERHLSAARHWDGLAARAERVLSHRPDDL